MSKRMPAQFKACEGCRHFQLLYFDTEAECSFFGRLNSGVVWCRQHEEENDVDSHSNSDRPLGLDHGD